MTGLSGERIAELRGQVRAEYGGNPFVDPRTFRHRSEIDHTPEEWRRALLGRAHNLTFRWMEPWEMAFLVRACEEDRAWLDAERARVEEEGRARIAADAARAAAAYRARQDEWEALRARLPVRVFVGHNWTIGHYDGFVSGRDHIVVQEELHVGRLHRPDRDALCETPSTARRQAGSRRGNTDPLRNLEREPGPASELDRLPTCRGCLRVAERIAAPAG